VALPGLLIEYLVVGSMALLWLLPLLSINFENGIPLGKAAALGPSIYVLGMFVDAMAFILFSKLPTKKYSLKKLVRFFVKKKPDIKNVQPIIFKDSSGRSSRGKIWLYLYEPALIREVQDRSSRDRVARGAVVNILLMWGESLLNRTNNDLIFNSFNNYHWSLLFLFSFLTWGFLESNSYAFELRTDHMIFHKLSKQSKTTNKKHLY